MKKRLFFLFLLMSSLIIFLTSCSTVESSSSSTIAGEEVTGATTDIEIEEDSVNDSFTLKDELDNLLSSENGVYQITSGGTYKVSGKLEGQIYVDASEADVELDLNGVSISNSTLAPIYVNDCDTLIIHVSKETSNYIYDNRTVDYSESDTEAQAAIYVNNGNLKVNGTGTLVVTSLYNSGIQAKDNVTIKNVTLLVKAMNNGIKGNDKVTIEENPTIGIVAGNNGIRTSNSDSGSSAQHGYIYINGGTITINSYGDGIDAAYAIEIGTSQDDSGTVYEPTIDIYTNIYSSYEVTSTKSIKSRGQFPQSGGGFNGGGFGGGTSAEKADSSAKALKACEYIKITAGNLFTYTYDDGIHTNADTLDTGKTATADILISGGTIKIKASDDGIHADGTLTVNGGVIYISESHEAIEGKIINIYGGETTVFASDDGVNASKQINISGGRLDVTVSPNGDTDGIDSNGTITITGGTTITRGPNSEMASPIDADGTIKITGGVLIVVGYTASISSTITKTSSSSGLSSGSHTVTIGSATITYNNSYTYSGKTTVYASYSATVK